MHRYLILIERTEGGYCAWCPDLPGCVAAGEKLEETELRMHEAVRLHLEGLKSDGQPSPSATTLAEYILV